MEYVEGYDDLEEEEDELDIEDFGKFDMPCKNNDWLIYVPSA